jgi:hypothetical protein
VYIPAIISSNITPFEPLIFSNKFMGYILKISKNRKKIKIKKIIAISSEEGTISKGIDCPTNSSITTSFGS